MSQRLLCVTQLSNYDTQGRWILECDSGWQMMVGRIREMLKLNPNLHITITGPHRLRLMTQPEAINPDLWLEHCDKLEYVQWPLIPNALVTRYDFDWAEISAALGLHLQKSGRKSKWDVVYLNDPMTLRGFKALFHIDAGYQPKFVVHSHFIDEPSCPKFPTEASLWMGQVEAARKADVNFWQCGSAMGKFFEELKNEYTPQIIEQVIAKSFPWDDGFSVTEMHAEPNLKNIRFNRHQALTDCKGKVVVFVPNRIGGRGRSSDYTNCGKFMFELLPELAKKCRNFVVIAGNPSQKFSNDELQKECGKHGYINLVPGALNRDEFKYIVGNIATIALGLYDQDTYGGTVARECVEMGCLPFWLDNYEYASLARKAGAETFLCKADFSDFTDRLASLIKILNGVPPMSVNKQIAREFTALQKVIRHRCSYEETTPFAMKHMGLL